MVEHLSERQIVERLRERRGLIPVAIDVRRRLVQWRDLDGYHSYEGFFRNSLRKMAALSRARGRTPETVTSDCCVLDSDDVVADHLQPRGFIFHAGRCGSTLLTKALARSRRHLVFGEPAVINQFWAVATDGWRQPEPTVVQCARFRRLVLAIGRPRLATHSEYFLKFTSFNVLFFEAIRSVFPEVPALFLYREPGAIVRSMLGRSPGWSASAEVDLRAAVAGADRNEIGELGPRAFAERALESVFSAALRPRAGSLRYLDYDRLTASNLPAVLRALDVTVTSEDLERMKAQFPYDSKDEHRARPYLGRRQPGEPGPGAGECATGRLAGLHQDLLRSPFNVAIAR